jgi:uncharacterized membrane protein YphA (DoxX/SURF4 family)
MNPTINIIRILVGALFIFSGLVKAIDPLGLSYKMQEFFELWKMTQFNSYTLLLSIVMIAFEIIAGVALLLGWRMKLFSWLLLLLIIFFTFLTGYAYLSGKFKNCGCFGDCIPITPLTSFVKDLVLLGLILLLFVYRNKIKPFFPEKINMLLMLLATVFSFGLQWYALRYLPPVDCLPFKKGNNISEKMKMPVNAIPDSVVMTFIYEKAGNRVEFTADKFPDDFNDSVYKFINRYDKVIRKGKNNEPPIKGFSVSGVTNIDSTGIILNMPYAVILFEEKPATNISKWEKQFREIQQEAAKKNIPVFIVTTSLDEYRQKRKTDLPVLKCDFTAIRTAARANPTLYLLKNGTIQGKWSYADFGKAIPAINSVLSTAKK